MALSVAVQMDPIERINIQGDSTFALLLEAQARGHSLAYYTPERLAMRDGKVFTTVQPLTVVDRAGSQLNGVSPTLVPYAVGGLPPSTTFRLVEWNRVGDGRTADAGSVTTDDAGVASFLVPLQAVFALTNG